MSVSVKRKRACRERMRRALTVCAACAWGAWDAHARTRHPLWGGGGPPRRRPPAVPQTEDGGEAEKSSRVDIWCIHVFFNVWWLDWLIADGLVGWWVNIVLGDFAEYTFYLFIFYLLFLKLCLLVIFRIVLLVVECLRNIYFCRLFVCSFVYLVIK